MMSEETLETLARTIHEDFLRREGHRLEASDADLSVLPWESLPETLRDSNRDQASDIERKLQAVGCEAIRASSPGPTLEFSDPEVELLARMEHDRWVAERRRDGWTLGPHRDVSHKTSPYLVPWAELSDHARDLDRETVRRIPKFLSGLGFAVVRRN
jgi:hypothetical protein